MRYPFTLVKVKSKIGTVWQARIWDESQQKYAISRSTGVLVEGKKENRREAEDVARKIYDELPKVLSTVTQTLIPAIQTKQGNLTAASLRLPTSLYDV